MHPIATHALSSFSLGKQPNKNGPQREREWCQNERRGRTGKEKKPTGTQSGSNMDCFSVNWGGMKKQASALSEVEGKSPNDRVNWLMSHVHLAVGRG